MNDEAVSNDWAGAGRRRLLVWGLPAAGLIVTGVLDIEKHAWPLLLIWMGVACVLNARRCGRLHCFFTGPFFLVMAAVSLAHGLKVVSLGPAGWSWIGGIVVAGWIVLHYGTEAIWGRYRGAENP